MNKTETIVLRAYMAPQCEVKRISFEGNLLASSFNTSSPTAIESYDVNSDDDNWE